MEKQNNTRRKITININNNIEIKLLRKEIKRQMENGGEVKGAKQECSEGLIFG